MSVGKDVGLGFGRMWAEEDVGLEDVVGEVVRCGGCGAGGGC